MHTATSLTRIIMSLPDGAFPRVNASMINSGEYVNCIASVVGIPVSFDGEGTVEFECVDGGSVQVIVSPEFAFVPGKAMEVMGAVQDDKSVQVRVVMHDIVCYSNSLFLGGVHVSLHLFLCIGRISPWCLAN